MVSTAGPLCRFEEGGWSSKTGPRNTTKGSHTVRSIRQPPPLSRRGLHWSRGKQLDGQAKALTLRLDSFRRACQCEILGRWAYATVLRYVTGYWVLTAFLGGAVKPVDSSRDYSDKGTISEAGGSGGERRFSLRHRSKFASLEIKQYLFARHSSCTDQLIPRVSAEFEQA